MRRLISVLSLGAAVAVGAAFGTLSGPEPQTSLDGTEKIGMDARTAGGHFDYDARLPAATPPPPARVAPQTQPQEKTARQSSGRFDFAQSSPLFTSGSPLPAVPAPVLVSGRALTDTNAEGEIHQAPVVVRSVESSAFLSTPSQTGPARLEAAPVAPPASRYELIVALQQELRRASCYAGAIDGDWGPGSRRAMGEFLTRVNATLPVHSPDHVQLALLRTHPGEVCGVSCGVGETLSASGRCVSRPIVARGKSETTVASSSPLVGKTTAGTASGRSAGWTTRVEATAQPVPLVVPAPRLAIRADQYDSAPFEGRMALSGPRPDDIPARETAPGVDSQSPLTVSPRPAAVTDQPTWSPPAQRAVRKAAPKPRFSDNKKARTKAQRQRALFKEAFGDTL